jgi:hypothetical protein
VWLRIGPAEREGIPKEGINREQRFFCWQGVMDRVTSLVCTGSVSNDSVLVFDEQGNAAKSTAEDPAKLAFY